MPIKVEAKRQKQKSGISFYRYIVVLLLILAAVFILNIAPDYIRNDIKDKVNLVVNNNNVTKKLKNDIIIKDDVIYISKEDVEIYFDNEIYYDEQYNQIVTTSETKVAVMPIDSKKIKINEANINIYAPVIKENDKYYIPFSEISKNVYNIESEYVEKTNTVIAVSLDKALKQGFSSKKNDVKYKTTAFSKTVDKLNSGDMVTIIEDNSENNDKEWTKIATKNGKIGYVKTNTLNNIQQVREDFEYEKQVNGKISLVWDYFSEYKKAPQRTGKIDGVNVVSPAFLTLKKEGKGEIITNIGAEGTSYIKWAHNNGYKVWVMFSNSSLKDTTSEVLNDFQLREQMINRLVKIVEQYDIDGINLDFENIYLNDKEKLTKLVVELAPRLRELGKVLSVDVTAPDGAEDWSLCYDRNRLAKAADYVVFMAYDQNGSNSKKVGTTAGYNWVVNGLEKFVSPDRENVDSNKLILAMPFFTNLWKIDGDNISSSTVSMKNIDNTIPNNVNKQWDDTLHQYYVEYQNKGITYKIWLEDIKSLTDKMSLIEKYNLAGASFWRKDMEDSQIWSVVNDIVLKAK